MVTLKACTLAALLPCVYQRKAASRPLVLRRYTQGSLCTVPALLRWHTPGECTVYHPQPGKEGVPRLVETGSSACASGANPSPSGANPNPNPDPNPNPNPNPNPSPNPNQVRERRGHRRRQHGRLARRAGRRGGPGRAQLDSDARQ